MKKKWSKLYILINNVSCFLFVINKKNKKKIVNLPFFEIKSSGLYIFYNYIF